MYTFDYTPIIICKFTFVKKTTLFFYNRVFAIPYSPPAQTNSEYYVESNLFFFKAPFTLVKQNSWKTSLTVFVQINVGRNGDLWQASKYAHWFTTLYALETAHILISLKSYSRSFCSSKHNFKKRKVWFFIIIL